MAKVSNQVQAARKLRIDRIRNLAGMVEGVNEDTLKSLTDAQIWALGEGVSPDRMVADDDHDLSWATAVATAEPEHHDAAPGEGVVTEKLPLKDIAVAGPMVSRAAEAANVLAKHPEIEAHFDELAKSREAVTIGPLVLVDDFILAYGDGDMAKAMEVINGTKDKQGWPESGTQSTQRTVNGVVIPGSNNPDKFQVPTTKADGTAGNRWTSFFQELIERHPYGRKQVELMNRLDSVGGPTPDAEFSRIWKDAVERKQERRRIAQRLNTTVGNARRARRIFGQIAAITEHTKGMVTVTIARKLDGQGNLTKELLRTPVPFKLENKNDPGRGIELMSIGSFLALKPALAKERTVAGLKATVSRKGQQGPQAGKAIDLTTVPPIEKVAAFLQQAEQGFVVTEYTDRLEKMFRSPGGKATMVTYYSFWKGLGYYFGPNSEFGKAAAKAEAELSTTTKAA